MLQLEKQVRNWMIAFLAKPVVKKAINEITEYVIDTIATAIAIYMLELKRRNETTKLTQGKNNVQLHSENQHNQEPEGESSSFRVISN